MTKAETYGFYNQTRPCNMPSGWAFLGPCAAGNVPAGGTAFALRPYRNFRVVVSFGRNDSTGAPFVIGEATGRDDVAGRLNGVLDFPRYGSVPCVEAARTPIECSGSAILYLLVINMQNVPVTFTSTPRISVGNATVFARQRWCYSNTLAPQSARTDVSPAPSAPGGLRVPSAVYIERPPLTASRNGRLVLEPVPIAQRYASGGAFTVFAISCS